MALAHSNLSVSSTDEPLSRTGRTAIILNKNAKRVGPKVRRRVVEAAPDADVFFTESLAQARFVTRRIVDCGYSTVVTGGGDGTVANTLNSVIQAAKDAGRQAPKFAVLRLGTGNAVADYLGARDYITDLKALDTATFRPMQLLQVDGDRRATFAGFGYDAFILNNYERMKLAAERFFLTRALFQSAAGYVISGIGDSVPRLLVQRPTWRVKVTNTGDTAYRLGLDGEVLQSFEHGETIYEGRTRACCMGTTPYYGFKFKIMPYADRMPGKFTMRMVNLPPLKAVWRLRSVWAGTYRHRDLEDFMVDNIKVEFDGPTPFQIAGDSAGEKSTVNIGIDDAVQCASF